MSDTIELDIEDVESRDSLSTTVLVGYIIVPVALYVIINIVGTYFYHKLDNKNLSPRNQRWSTASVVLGWILFPPFNFTSPILYSTR